ncbi:beta-lactamase family protein [Siccirubricoccus sp. KC 17139]|uniref:Beta-lactamase family protein n=1 Tax=Siccirubricoccus soli TaxID=2899147 RepID=A0ABT1D529_9PROT|nr:serine hydrolase domain-containing protein [Siccirubricoccus soli]MCO6416309.1 beta-lactamase family protein [Siccirubricoccus soli]MCP2682443.1 beta-lactamase family protein [Siccirubricoccus soli]
MQAIDALLRAAVERGDVVGIAAAAGNAASTLYEGAAGSRGSGQPMAPDTVGWLASMTKAITTVAVLQQVEAGRLSLDAPIAEVLPALARPMVLEGRSLRPAKGAITLRQLLTHTSGFGYNMWHADLAAYMAKEGIPPVASCRLRALEAPLVADPGTAWNYGIGIDWAGQAAEAVTGKTLDALIREGVTGPLGMTDTVFRLGPVQRAKLSAMHKREADGRLTPIPFEMPQEPEFFMGGGGLYGTARDYLRFCRMWLNHGMLDGAQVLRPETVAEAMRDHLGPLAVQQMVTAVPEASYDVPLFPGMRCGWGLSFLVNDEVGPDGRSAGSVFWAGLSNCYYWIDPKRDRAGVIVTQSLPFADPRVLAVLAAFERAIYA